MPTQESNSRKNAQSSHLPFVMFEVAPAWFMVLIIILAIVLLVVASIGGGEFVKFVYNQP